MITETAEEIAFRFLSDLIGEPAATTSRREAMYDWNLTLQLCVSFMDEIAAAKRGTDVEKSKEGK